MKLISGFIDTYLRLNSEEESLLESEIARIEPAQQEVVMEIVTSWMERGIEQGLQTGLQQGKQEEALALILRLLPRRIGVVNPELQGNIRSLSVSQLEELAEALLDFSHEADLIAWLQQISVDSSVQN